MEERHISLDAINILSFSCSYTCDVMKRRVLIESRMRPHQRNRDQQLTKGNDPTNLVTTRKS